MQDQARAAAHRLAEGGGNDLSLFYRSNFTRLYGKKVLFWYEVFFLFNLCHTKFKFFIIQSL